MRTARPSSLTTPNSRARRLDGVPHVGCFERIVRPLPASVIVMEAGLRDCGDESFELLSAEDLFDLIDVVSLLC
jgi:hypothetical protein